MSSSAVDPKKYAEAKDGVLDLILEESDKRVAAQVQLMLAADSRATGILSGCITLAAAGIGFAASQLGDPTPLFFASLAFGLVEALAASMALWSLWPEPVSPPGWAPVRFSTDLEKTKATVQGEMAEHVQKRIENNRATARRLSGRIKAAMLFAVQGPVLGLGASLAAADEGGWALVAFGVSAALFLFLGVKLLPGARQTPVP